MSVSRDHAANPAQLSSALTARHASSSSPTNRVQGDRRRQLGDPSPPSRHPGPSSAPRPSNWPFSSELSPALLGERVEMTPPLGAVTADNAGEARNPLPVADGRGLPVGLAQRRRTQPGHDGGTFQSRCRRAPGAR